MGTNLCKFVPIRLWQDYLHWRQATVIVAGCSIRRLFYKPCHLSYPCLQTKWFKTQPSDCPFGFLADPFQN